ncbi:MAG: hypothetical protein JNL10_16270, partial [Verrucomicrobiales bacterium]|nr:hypothetical protein [Verrucomicrobiales bacterium]
TSDGDFFFRVGDGGFGQGGGGYEGNTKMEVGKWHRVAFAVDMAATPPVVTKYLDGQKHADQLAPNNLLDGVRRSLDPASAALFGDGDDGELHPVYVNSVQIRSGKLSDAELAALGAATASGIPVVLPKSNVAGQWDFNNGTLAATVGKDLEYLDGADGLGKANTTFGTTTSYGIPDIGGKPASVVHLPGRINPSGPDVENRASGLLMRHGIPANGGGSRVNQYTLIADVYWESGPGFASFLNVDGANTSDGDFFFRVADGGFGQGGGGYEGNTKMEIEKWHRVAFAVDMAATPPVVTKFLDGQKHADQTAPNNLLDGVRRSLDPASAALFGDGDDGELHPVYVNSVQIRAGKLSDAELASLGAATAEGIPLFLTVAAPPSLSVGTDSSGNVVITYTGTLQSAVTVGGTYSDVQGASSPYTITKANLAGAQYFRATE